MNKYFEITLSDFTIVSVIKSGTTCKENLLNDDSKIKQILNVVVHKMTMNTVRHLVSFLFSISITP